MKIAVIGAGKIGGTLGRKWAAAGLAVHFGVREPGASRYTELRGAGVVETIEAAVAHGEVVVLALPNAAVPAFAARYGQALARKIVIDTTNDFRRPVMHSLDILAEQAPAAILVRAFNHLGWENFAQPEINGEQVDLFFCGDPAARQIAEQLIAATGLRPVYIGGLETAAGLDGMTRVWAALAMGQGFGRRVTFKLLAARQPG